jgi:hypothetical protein
MGGIALPSTRRKQAPYQGTTLQLGEKVDIWRKWSKNKSRHKAQGAIAETWLMVFYPPNLTPFLQISTFSPSCLVVPK